MSTVRLNAKDFIDTDASVVQSAASIAAEASRLLATGDDVVISVHGVRGVSSSFFNVILSAVAQVVRDHVNTGRFSVETETATQKFIYQRSFDAFFPTKV